MSIDIALTTAVSSLKVNQEAIAIVASNVANANSEGYTRRIGSQKSQVVNGQVAGVQISEIRRAVDDLLVKSARIQIAEVGKTEASSTYLSRIQDFFGQPGAANGLNSSVDKFFAEIASVSVSPDQSTRNRALQQAISLADRVSGLAADIETTRFDIDHEIKNTIDDINTLLNKLGNLNTALREVSVNGGDNTALLDERDALLSDLGKFLDVSVSFSDKGEVSVGLPRGELLTPVQRTRIDYSPAPSVSTLINGDILGAISVIFLDQNGNDTTGSFNILSASNATTKDIGFSSGTLKGLIDLRDTDLPAILTQLDEFTKTFADAFNAIHNDGAGFPPPTSLTGTKSVKATDEFFFSGQARIALLQPDGTPVLDAYDSSKGYPPLTIDFDKLNGGSGQGSATVQTIMDEINNYYGPPPAQMVSLGKLHDIKLAAVSSNITSVEATGSLTFSSNPGVGDTITINGTTYTFVATGTASNGTNIERKTSLNVTVSEIASHLNAATSGGATSASYSSSNSTLNITHKTSGTAGNALAISADLTISGLGATASVNGGAFGGTPSGTLQNGEDASGNFEFDFEFSNISSGAATFEVLAVSVDGGATGFTGTLPADFSTFNAAAGERVRTGADNVNNDTITVDLTNSTQGEGSTHTISVQMRVTNPDGTIVTDTVEFTVPVPDPNTSILNDRYITNGTTGGIAVVDTPNINQRFATASIVDADGNTITNGTAGFLKIQTDTGSYGIAIDELNSSENGTVADAINTRTNRGFSHFFGLNDFFNIGATSKNSSINFDVRDAYKADSGRLAAGELSLSTQPADPASDPIYTYEFGIGSDQLAKKLAALGSNSVNFNAAGGLPSLTLSIGGYAAEITSFASNQANIAEESQKQAEILFDAFNDKIKETSEVNVDEELANTLKFQNNYAASARLVNVISDLFQRLIDAF